MDEKTTPVEADDLKKRLDEIKVTFKVEIKRTGTNKPEIEVIDTGPWSFKAIVSF